MSDRPPWVDAALAAAPVARLATVGTDGTVHLVPFCFAVVGERLVSAVDHKPKRHTRLQRLADIAATGRAAVLVDHYSDDWSELWWIRVAGPAAEEPAGSTLDAAARAALVAKYQQYRDATARRSGVVVAPRTRSGGGGPDHRKLHRWTPIRAARVQVASTLRNGDYRRSASGRAAARSQSSAERTSAGSVASTRSRSTSSTAHART